jgi:O-antigen ligase
VYFGFSAGGYFAGSVAVGALLVTVIVALRMLFARQPFAGFSRAHAAMVGVFTAYAAWTLASGLWSHAEDRAITEFDRALLYLMLLLLGGLVPRSMWRMRWITRGIALGAFVVCTAGLITRVLPRVWPEVASLANNRLSFPVTYWNALGILASIGILLLVGIASDPLERRIGRALAAAAVPPVATTLLFTFSRGAIIALIFGLIVFVVIGRSGAIVGAAVAIAPATAGAVITGYDATLLYSSAPASPAAVVQGHHVALALALAMLVAAIVRWSLDPLDRWLIDRRPRVMRSAQVRRSSAGVGLALLLVAAIVAGGPGWVAKEYRLFARSAPVSTVNVNQRLTSASGNGRVELWRVALKAFASAPINGTGAGTYEFDFYRYRDTSALTVVDAHELYLQTLAELGLIGLVLLVGTLGAITFVLGRRSRGPDRVLYAALFSAVLAWALHAAIDWDWQMPVVTLWVFAVGGAVLATDSAAMHSAGPSIPVRAVLTAALFLVCTAPAVILLSQVHLQRAADAFQIHDCPHAQSEAASSITVLSVRPEPYQILGYCDMADGRTRSAVVAMRSAVEQEPSDWQYRYGLAIADGLAGINPRPELRTAERMDPEDKPFFQPLLPVLKTRRRSAWARAAEKAEVAAVTSGRLSLR